MLLVLFLSIGSLFRWHLFVTRRNYPPAQFECKIVPDKLNSKTMKNKSSIHHVERQISLKFSIGMILFALIYMSNFMFAQNTLKMKTYACKQQMTMEGKEQVLVNGKIDIYVNDTILFKTVLPNDTGVALFELPFGNLFRLTYRYPGFVPASSLVSTQNIQANAPNPLTHLTLMFLAEDNGNADVSLLNLPLIKYKYNPKQKAMWHDEEYLKVITYAIRSLGKFEAEIKAEREQKIVSIKRETEKELAAKGLLK
jgi:hypothetical protein